MGLRTWNALDMQEVIDFNLTTLIRNYGLDDTSSKVVEWGWEAVEQSILPQRVVKAVLDVKTTSATSHPRQHVPSSKNERGVS